MSSWKRKKNYNGKNKNYSLSNKLRKERKSNEEFEIMLSNLTLEESIGLKLELASRSISNRLYGFPLWHAMNDIIKDAVFKYAFSATRTQAEAMRFLGLKENSLHELIKKYGIDDYFTEENKNKEITLDK
jgi:DNA-binding NtrC family response regulator|tara:strand:- start:139 stop:528 length:390 start_codon:yes stop_codon:yes gene_type:complete